MESAKKVTSIQVRMSEDLKDWLKGKAVTNFRSLNGEIVARLEESRKAELLIDDQQRPADAADE